jgi:hypothetical protein
MLLLLSFDSEMDILLSSGKCVQKLIQFRLSMIPDLEFVINIVKQADGPTGCPWSASSSKFPVKKLAMFGDKGEPITTPSVCSKNCPLKYKLRILGHCVTVSLCHLIGTLVKI